VGRLIELRAMLGRDSRAPTAIRDPGRVTTEHIADSLAALELEPVRQARSVADLGSGAGFPGLPLALALPAATVYLVESVRRKADWLARTVSALGVENARVVDARAEDWPEGLGRLDVVTARALDSLPVLVEYAAPLLREGGALVAWKGSRSADEEADGAAAAEHLGMALRELRPVTPYKGSRNRHLYLYEKVRMTPEGFPRAPGRARKRPIGAAR
jgi:16S rRNA (guanine527-N7)-methyltransferase